MSTNYLTEKEVEVLHLAIMKKHNDLEQAGIRDHGLFQSAVLRPQTGFGETDIFPTHFQKAAALLDGLVNNHPFHNGNKRTAWVATKAFLKLNGFHLKMTTEEGIDLMVNVATKKYPFPDGLANELEKYSLPIKDY
jgi:death-on-curing protein